ncbi:MAG: choice-of-anchor Q domain-containing protein, partial [Pseudonocardiaceae bacterium]
MLDADLCRASGDAISLVTVPGQTSTVRHTTITGDGIQLITSSEGDATAKVRLENNLLYGRPSYGNALTAGHYTYNSPTTNYYSGNIFWNVKSAQCPSGSICGQDPKVTNSSLTAFDAEPLAGSPAIDKVAMLSGVSTDFVLQPRPSGSASDIGAYEFQAGGATPPPTPTPTCTRAAPTFSMTGPAGAVAAGTANSYSLSVRNNDSAACSNTAFSLARSVPTGWTGALSTTGVTLAPGASANATLQVTSPATAAANSYGFGAGISSNVGGTHTGNVAGTYVVAAPVVTPPPTETCARRAPTISVTGPAGAVSAGSSVNYTV